MPLGPGAEAPAAPTLTFLPNRLGLIVDREGSRPIVAVSLVVHAGWAAAPPTKPGLAAMVAWLLADTQRATVLAMGGITKVAVGFDSSSLAAFAPYPRWRELAALRSHLLATRPDELTQTDFQRSRARLVRRLDVGGRWQDSATVFGRLASRVYEATDPYAIGGQFSPEAVERITLEDVRAFVATHYRPSHATLYLGGDLPAESTIIRAGLTADLPADTVARPDVRPAADQTPSPLALPRRSGGGDVPIVHAAVPAPEAWVAWPVPGAATPEAPLADVAAAAGDTLVRTDWFLAEDPDITAASVAVVRGARGSLFIARAMLAPGASPGRALMVLKRAITNLWAAPLVDEPRQEWRTIQMLVESQLGLDALEGRALWYPTMARLTGDPAFVAHALRGRLHDAQGSEAKEFVLAYLTADKARAIYVSPGDNATLRSEEHAPDSVAPTPRDPAPTARPFPGEDNPIVASQSPRIETRTLPNGLTAIVALQPAADSAAVLLGHRGGKADTKPLGAAEIVSVAGVFAGGHLDCVAVPGCGVLAGSDLVEEERVAFRANADRAALPDTLDALSRKQFVDWVEWPDGKAAQRFIALRRVWEARPDRSSTQKLFERIHPTLDIYQPARVASLLAISSDTAKTAVHAQSGARNSALVVVGPVNPRSTFAQIERAFGDWEAGAALGSARRPPLPAPAPHADIPVLTTPWPGSSRARVSFGCRLPPAEPGDDAWRALLAQQLASGMDAVLDGESAADGTATFEGRRHVYEGGASDIFVDGLVSPPAVAPMVAGLRRIVADLGLGILPDSSNDKDLDGARWRVVTRHALEVGSPTSLARELFAEWSRGERADGGTRALAGLGRRDPMHLASLTRLCHATAVISVAVDPRFYPPSPSGRASSPSP